MCVLFQEDGTETVMEILGKSYGQPEQDDAPVIVSFIALMGTEYWLLRRFSTREAGETLFLVENCQVEVQESSSDLRHEAGRVKATARGFIHCLRVGPSEDGRIKDRTSILYRLLTLQGNLALERGQHLPLGREDYQR